MKNSGLKRPKSLPKHLAPIWDEIAEEFNPRVGTTGLGAVCGQVYLIRECQAKIGEEGVIVAGMRDGAAAEHPAVKIEAGAQAALRIWREKFGIVRK